MHDDQDPVIRRLFAEQERSRPSDDFMLQLGKRIDARQRGRRANGILAIVLCLVLSAVSAPWVALLASTLVDATAAGVRTGGPLFQSPMTWLVVAATAIGWSPVVYLWRTGRW
jgi:hypothetical protein